MPKTTALKPAAPWVELKTTKADWDAADPALLQTMLVQLHLIRAFEEYVLELAGQKLINGPAHSSIGQEGGAVGSALPLVSADQINGSHRGHHQFLAKAFGHVQPAGFDAKADFTPEVRDVLYRALSEIAGLKDGYCGGRGGSMHLQWIDAGAMGTNAIVGGAVPFAVGFGWADRHAGTDNVAISYFGDGAVNIGSVLESFNLSSAWDVPVSFFIENNQYAVSTNVNEATGEARLSGRGLGFGIPSWRVDGQDTLAVYLATQQAVEHMRAGGGPTIIEADTYRYFHQNGPFPGSAFGYRTKEEEQSWRDRDPILLVESHLVRRGILTADEAKELRTRVKSTMAEIGDRVVEADPNGKPGSLRIRTELWPDTSRINEGIRGDIPSFEGLTVKNASDFAESELRDAKFVDVIAETMHRRMSQDDSIITLGEDIHRLSGGSRGATKGLADDFPARTLGTPISENAFTGFAGGVAMDGRYYPVIELMYADFLWVAADQLFNQIGKARHMFGGQSDMPLIMRIKIGTNTGYGSQHSMDPAGILATSVGWRIIAPSTPLDYVGLLNTAMRLKDPVAVLEHDADLYKTVGKAPIDLDYLLPFGKAEIRRSGSEVTVISYLSMVQRALDAVEQTGVDGEVIDLRWLDKASVDWDAIGESITKTNRVVIVEQGAAGTSYGGWLSDEIQRRYFDYLDAPVTRVSGSESSPSISKVLEAAALASTDDIVAAIRGIV
ncbi:alpha-ketoacid dehydrogenase subunit alpha/beta [Schumannella soli]|uniref:dihydrolipoyllysine-residue succinyltransferase n=1 Tax=Schumannella soli TaxID=2590779 RepID=A0A506XYH8_9MICO|nr:alpha-ketoacid dehydrogenase subunit alpha/beta [Schumannella soli]TPW74845.1 MFS transporter [Schumannella soli]